MNFDFSVRSRTTQALRASLSEIEQAQLILALYEIEPAYLFKHALVQDSAYESLMKHDRKRLHRFVAETLEHALSESLDENAALLAHHFEFAEDPARALAYLQRAAEWSRRAGAHREEADLLARALALAADIKPEILAELRARRGKAFANLTRLDDARQEYLTALKFVSPEDAAQRAQILNELAVVMQWLFDVNAARQYAQEALTLAERAGRDDLAAQAMSSLAFAITSDGDVRGGLEYYARAFQSGGADLSPALVQSMEFSGLALYWIGEYTQAAARIREAIARARDKADSFTIMRGLGNLGMVLTGQGEYAQALETFQAARDYGEEHDVKAFLARALAMEAGLYLELYDYRRAEETALEARAVARAANFPGSATNAAIDLMINYARRGDFYLADQYIRQVEQVIPKTYGSHRWLFELRFAYARAELALARLRWQSALELADAALAQSRARGRGKYEALALVTRAHARAALQDPAAARRALQDALTLARRDGNPSLLLHVACPLFHLAPSDALYAEIRAAKQRVHAQLPDGALRARFDAVVSEWV